MTGENNMDNRTWNRNRAAVWIAAAACIYLMTYRLSLKESLLPFSSDMVTHIKYAVSLDHVLKLTHFGWHFVCWALFACLPIDITEAAAAATALFNVLSGLLTLCFIERIVKPDYKKGLWPGAGVFALCVVCLTVGPLYLRFFNMRYYLGQGTPNPWHNPTSIAVRPFLLALCLLIEDYWMIEKGEKIYLFGKERNKAFIYQIVMGILLAAGTLVKPSILMVYFPACAVIALAKLIKGRGRNFFTLLVQHLYFLPALFIILWQFISIYISGTDKYLNSSTIVIDFFYTARLHTSSFVVSLLLRMAFPFLVIVIWRKEIFKQPLFRLIMIQYLIGLATTWTFRETGRRANHGNFGWGNILACSIVWIYTICFFISKIKEDPSWYRINDGIVKRLKYLLPLLLLAWHAVAGLCYYCYLLKDWGVQL